jgi:hypothetical protein
MMKPVKGRLFEALYLIDHRERAISLAITHNEA